MKQLNMQRNMIKDSDMSSCGFDWALVRAEREEYDHMTVDELAELFTESG